ncbi:hypothetical protein VTK56DRAFT_1285 [Thermocarpiscus australiensis]
MKVTETHPAHATIKRVDIIHTAEQLPFGPYAGGVAGHCMSPKEEDAMLRKLDGVWTVSKALHDYAWKYGKLETTFLIHPTMTYLDNMGGMPLVRNNVDKLEVGMVNPCPIKGVGILIALAENLPEVNFVTWKSWGSDPEHIEKLRELPNVAIEPTTRNTEEIFDRIKVLIAPSMWFEAWGIIVTEAQLRGIPVIASNAGGLPEAKIGVPFCIPVKPLTGEKQPNGQYVVPEQDIKPWVDALSKLMKDRNAYLALADQTATRAQEWLLNLDERAHEQWLLSMM